MRNGWMTVTVAITLMAVLPAISLVALGLRTLWRRANLQRTWLWVWLLPLLLLLSAAISHGWSELFLVSGQFGLAIFAAYGLRARRGIVSTGLALTMVVFALSGIAERQVSAHIWEGHETRGLFPMLRALITEQSAVERQASRRWLLPPDTESVELSFKARSLSGQAGWNWFRSDGRFELKALDENGEPFTRVVTPIGPDPYLMRTFDLGEPIAGGTFRVELEMRAPKHIPLQTCRGVWLMTWYEGADRKCLETELLRDWRPFELTWTVPDRAVTSVIRVVLNNFDGYTYDVRRVRLYETTLSGDVRLEPLFPEAATVQLALQGQSPESQSGFNFEPGNGWQRHEFALTDFNQEEDSTLSATLYGGRAYGGDLVLETRSLELQTKSAAGEAPRPIPSARRQSFWSQDPNLAAHSIAAAGLTLLSLTGSSWLGLGGTSLTLFGVWLAGSRAAWLGATLGLFWLLWLIARPRRRQRRIFFLLSPIAAIAVALPALDPTGLGRLGSDDQTPRALIWQAAGQAFMDNIETGIGTNNFSAYFVAQFGELGRERVTHAHNFWLALASSYGVIGLVAALWVTGTLLYFAWRWGKWRGLGLVVPILVMQIFDYTLFHAGVLFPLVLGLNVMKEREGEH